MKHLFRIQSTASPTAEATAAFAEASAPKAEPH
jgi:hypothetical protein